MRNIFTSTPLHKPHCVRRWLIPIGIGIPRHYALCIMDWLRIHRPVCSIYWSFEFEMVCLLGSCLTGGPWLGVCVCVKICMQTVRWEQKKGSIAVVWGIICIMSPALKVWNGTKMSKNRMKGWKCREKYLMWTMFECWKPGRNGKMEMERRKSHKIRVWNEARLSHVKKHN